MTLHSIYLKIMVLSVALISSANTVTGKPLKIIGGDISGRTFSSDTLYQVNEDITVPAGQRCHIPAGTAFLFGEAVKFTINGTVTIDGDEGSEVIFTSFNDKTVNDSTRSTSFAGLIDWQGIHFGEGAEKSAVRYLEIRHADNPVTSDIPSITGRNVHIADSYITVVLYKDNEVAVSEFFKHELNNTPEKTVAAIPTGTPPQPIPESVTNPNPGWMTKNKIRAGFALSTAAATTASIGSFIYANKHAERRDELRRIYYTDENKSLEQRESAFDDSKFEHKITKRLFGLGIMGIIAGLASLTGFGFTFHF